MKTGLITLTIIILTIGLWQAIGALTLLVLPVTLIFLAAAATPLMTLSAETRRIELIEQAEMPTAVTFAIAASK